MLHKNYGVHLRRSKIKPETNTHIIFVDSITSPQKTKTQHTVSNYGDVYYEELRALWIFNRLFGTFLLEKQKSGRRKFKVISWSVLYSLVFYLGFLYLTYFLGEISMKDHFQYSSNFYTHILPIIYLSYFIPHILSIPTHLIEVKNLEEQFNMWLDFAISFNHCTKRPLQLHLRNTCLWTIFAMVLFCCIYIGISAFLFPINFIGAVYYFYSLMLMLLHINTWCMSCLALKRAMEKLQSFIKVAVENTGNSKDLDSSMYLWLKISKITNSVGKCFGQTCAGLLLLLFILTTLSAYVILSTQGVTKSDIHLFALLLLNGFMIAATCDFAHHSSMKIGPDFTRFLASCIPVNQAAERYVRHFLTVVTANSPTISLNGYCVIDRKHAVSVLSTIITFLIVLVQFGNNRLAWK